MDAVSSMATLKNQNLLVPEGDAHFRIERNLLVAMMDAALSKIKFDEAWYLSKYPDVRDAVKRGKVTSGRQHYLQFGYFEHRMPTAILVNEKWYLDAYKDVAEAIRAGIYKNAQAHFDIVGFGEGRLPFANFKF